MKNLDYNFNLISAAICIAFVGSALGCGGTEVPDYNPFPPPNSGDGTLPLPELTAPTITKMPSGPVCDSVVAIGGKAFPNSDVIAQGTGGTIGTTASASGDFCLPVPLLPGQINAIRILAHHYQVGASPSTDIQVNANCAKKSTTPGPAPSEPKNWANHAVVSVSHGKAPVDGEAGSIVDGNDGTHAEWAFTDFDGATWSRFSDSNVVGHLKIELLQPVIAKQIKIIWENGETGSVAETWKVQTSSAIGASMETESLWSTVYEDDDGSGGTTVINLNDAEVKGVALIFNGDNQWGGDEHFSIAEIQVIGTPKISNNVSNPTALNGCR